MRVFFLASFSLLFISFGDVNAVPSLRTAIMEPMTQRLGGVIKQRWNAMGNEAISIQKRGFNTTLKTIGYRPKEDLVATHSRTLIFPKRLEYLDGNYERFRAPPEFLSVLEASLKCDHEHLNNSQISPVDQKKK